MKVISWNVNGLRACANKGFAQWLRCCGADVVCLQEVRAMPEQLPLAQLELTGWYCLWSPAQKPGYSGVGLLSRQQPQEVVTSLDDPAFDQEGRVILARFGQTWVGSIYFPNGNGSTLPNGKRSNDRVPFKLAFYRALFDRVHPWAAQGLSVVIAGDWNTAPQAIDLARPKDNQQTSGFLPEERLEVARWVSQGWVDSFRRCQPEARDVYSWWSQRFGVRARNVGWRIDLALLSPVAEARLVAATVDTEVQGSDHCPISVELREV